MCWGIFFNKSNGTALASKEAKLKIRTRLHQVLYKLDVRDSPAKKSRHSNQTEDLAACFHRLLVKGQDLFIGESHFRSLLQFPLGSAQQGSRGQICHWLHIKLCWLHQLTVCLRELIHCRAKAKPCPNKVASPKHS